MEEKTPLSPKLCAFRSLKSRPYLRSRIQFNSDILVRNCFFLKNYFTSEGAVSHNVLYSQQLSIACYQVCFYAIETIILGNFKNSAIRRVIKLDPEQLYGHSYLQFFNFVWTPVYNLFVCLA